MNYEVGKWYWFEYVFEDQFESGIVKCDAVTEDKMFHNESYFSDGFAELDIWCKYLQEIQGLATPEQIEQCLKAYAQKSGYVEGAKIRSFISKNINLLVQANNYYDSLSDEYWLVGALVYRNGQWAELIKEEPTQILTTTPVTSGYMQAIPGTKSYYVDDVLVPISDLIECYRKHGKK